MLNSYRQPVVPSPHAPTPRGRGAFTLIELLIVVAIIIIVMAVTFPAFRKITVGNNRRQSVNAISAQVASARSMALSLQKQVGVVFYEDPVNRYQTRMVLVQAVSNLSGGVTEFGAIPDRPPVALPKFVKVSTLDVTSPTGAFQAEWYASNQKLRMLVFDETGKPVVRNGIRGFDIGGSNPRSASPDWGLANSGDNAATFASSMSLVLYDTNELKDAYPDLSTPANQALAATWLLKNCDIITLNPYTGVVLR